MKASDQCSTREQRIHPNRDRMVPCGYCRNGLMYDGDPSSISTRETPCDYCRGTGRRRAA